MTSSARNAIAATMPWLAFWRWRRTSLGAAFCVASLMLLLNSVPQGKTYHGVGDFYGWPQEFIGGYSHGPDRFFIFSLVKGTIEEFDAMRLVLNIAVAAAMTGATGLIFEYRYRRWRKKAWQFSMNELFTVALAIAAGLCLLVRQNIREEVALNQLRCHFVACSIVPDAVRRYLPNMPGGWLKPFDRVASLHIMAGVRADDYFVTLEQFPEVKELAIEADFGDGALLHISRMRGLRYLSLESPRLTGESLQALTLLPKLRHLRMRTSRLSDEGLRHLSRLTDVEIDLDLRGVKVTSARLRELAPVTGLRGLCLGQCHLDDNAISAVSQITQLERLTLDSTRQRSGSLIHLARLPRLSSLQLLNIGGTNFRALEDFRRQLPRCAIYVR